MCDTMSGSSLTGPEVTPWAGKETGDGQEVGGGEDDDPLPGDERR